jgi:nucleoside-diphosphate-sugar epimerase
VRVLLIGGSGFVGRRVASALAKRGASVGVVCRSRPAMDAQPSVTWIQADRRSLGAARTRLGRFRPDVAVDLIAYTEQDAAETLAALRGVVEHCVVLSSGDVYLAYGRLTGFEPGPPEPPPIAEDSPLRTRRYPYRHDKARAADDPARWMDDYDKILVESAFRAESGLETTVLRLPMVYGPDDRQHRFAEPILRMLAHRPVILLEESFARWRCSFSFVDNVAEAVSLAALGSPASATYNVAESDAPSQMEWVDALASAAGWAGELRLISGPAVPDHLSAPSRTLDLRQPLVLSSSRLRNDLGFREVVGREVALRRTLDWERSLDEIEGRLEPEALDAEDRYLADSVA